MNIEQNVIEKLRQLPLAKQQELLDLMDSLANKTQVSQTEKSLKDLLQEMPDLGEDADFIHVRDSARQISL